MKRFLLLFFAFFILITTASAQNDSDIAFPRGRLFFGVNAGMAWQKADVRSRLGVGWGMTLEKFLTRSKTPFWGWSIRGRLLAANTWGGDLTSSNNIQFNPALNGTYNPNLDYTSSNSIYHNYNTSLAELDLELKLYFNRAFHRSNFSPYIFGGIGGMAYTTKMDQLGADGNIYDYSDISPLKGIARENLKDLRDGVYESSAENKGEPSYAFSPGFGAGFAIKLGPGAQLGLEHKVSLPNTNLLDGQRWNQNNQLISKNDIHHYSNFWVSFRLFGNRTGSTTVLYQPSLRVIRSEVNTNCETYIEIQTQYVTSVSQIEVSVNGTRIQTGEIAFNSRTGVVVIRRRIFGATTIDVVAANMEGRTRESISLNCDGQIRPVELVPTISILEPSASITASCDAYVRAQVRNIQNKGQIAVSANGMALNPADYYFDPNTGILEIRSQLNENTIFEIRVANQAGANSARVSFNCTQRVVTPQPEVILVNPNSESFNSSICDFNFRAEVRNVQRKDQITVRVDNVVLNQSQFNFNSSTNLVSFNLQLSDALTRVRITASTEGGTDTKIVTLNCTSTPPRELAPIITLNDPNSAYFETQNCPYTIRASVQNVNLKNQIAVYRNGNLLSQNLWQWDATRGVVSFNSDNGGSTTYRITAQNNAGTDQQELTLVCRPRVLPPTVNIQYPAANPYTSLTCRERITAYVRNVEQRNQIEVYINNNPINFYSYNATSGLLTLDTDIFQTTSVRIRATNAAGTANDETTIICQPPVSPPNVQITSPSQNPFETENCLVNIQAQTQNVEQRGQISITAGGQNVTNYNFVNGRITFQVQAGVNTVVRITVRNNGGSATDETIVMCKPPVLERPNVRITTPSQNPFETENCNVSVQAQTQNVELKSQITVSVGGQNISDFTFANNRVNFQVQAGVSTPVRVTVRNATGSASDEKIIICKPPVLPPIVKITAPNQDPFTTQTCDVNIQAQIQNIEQKNQITVTANGQVVPNFNYANGQVTFQVTATESTTVRISASNIAGNANDQVVIRCIPPVVLPTVKITSPSENPYETTNCEVNIQAETQNVAQKNQITITANGQRVNTFDFANNRITFPIQANASTTIRITVSNSAGSATDETLVRCTPPLAAPVVRITAPSENPYETTNCEVNIQAETQNVAQKNQITITANGQRINTFDFANNRITFPIQANASTTIRITVSNSAGSATDETLVRCTPPLAAPVVRITAPSENPYETTNCEVNIQAETQNVAQKNQITITANGQRINTFDFANGKISFPIQANASTTIRITVSNSAGSATDETLVRCTPPLAAPVVRITSPSENPYETTNCEVNIQAETQNVAQKNQITITANGQRINTFDFANGKISFPIQANASTTIRITVSNSAGSATDETLVRCTPPLAAPVVRITSPSENPYETTNCEVNIQAETQNVAQKNQITITANGQRINTFDFANGKISFPIQANASTTIRITVSNSAGSATDETLVRCTPPLASPTVKITSPSENPYETTNCEVNIQAETQNVAQKNQITITANGQRVNTFDFANNRITFPIQANASTTIRITVSNSAGSATDETLVRCTPPLASPTVKITSPSENPYETTNCEVNIQAETQNVAQKNQITITANGQRVNTFDFANGKISFPIQANASTTIRITVSNSGGSATDETVIRCKPPVVPPSVRIVNPSQNPYNTENCEVEVSAEVQNVDTRGQIAVLVGSQSISNFTFTNGRVSFIARAGENTRVKITVSNAGGSATDELVIACKPPVEKPTVRITNPSQNPFETENCEVNVQAEVGNIEQRNQISITANGQNVSNFSFANGRITFQVRADQNTPIKITVTNGGGSASDETVIVCKPKEEKKITICHIPPGNPDNPQTIEIPESAWPAHEAHGDTRGPCPPVEKPTVRITNPSQNPLETSDCEVDIQAQTENVKQKSQISITANGQNVNNYNFDNGRITFRVRADENTPIRISVSNSAGSASDETVIRCKPPVAPPTIKIVNPSQNPFETENCEVNVQAETGNIEQRNQISVSANGQNISNFSFANGRITFQIRADENTPIRITVSNSAGSASDETLIRCKPPIVPPTVKIVNPSQNPFETENCDVNFRVETTNIDQKNQVSINVNGQNFQAFGFNNGVINFKVRAEENTPVRVTVTNSAGSASDDIVLRCKQIAPPTVRIVNPSQNPFETEKCDEVNFRVETTNIEQKNQVSINVNGQNFTAFGFNNGVINFKVKADENTPVRVTVTNPAGSASDETVVKCKEEKKITICHYPPGNTDNPQTIEIPESAWPAHEAHGDTRGPCPPMEKPTIQFSRTAQNLIGPNDCEVSVEIIVGFVRQKSQIVITVDGENFTKFGYNPSTGKVNFKIKADDSTMLRVTATNSIGTGSDELEIKCDK